MGVFIYRKESRVQRAVILHLLFIFYVYIPRKNSRKKKNKDRTNDKNRKEKCFCGWPEWRFHGWLNVWLTDTETHLDEWLAEFLWQKYVNGIRVDVLVRRKILW